MDEMHAPSAVTSADCTVRNIAPGGTPRWVAGVLDSIAFSVLARLVLTFGFWLSALQKLFDFPGAIDEMQLFKLSPPVAYAIAALVVQIVGTALIMWGRYVWLGAGVLAVFTALTIPVAHRFWDLSPPQSIDESHAAIANVSLIGGLIAIAMWRYERARRRGRY